jgi:hypothetical protein
MMYHPPTVKTQPSKFTKKASLEVSDKMLEEVNIRAKLFASSPCQSPKSRYPFPPFKVADTNTIEENPT